MLTSKVAFDEKNVLSYSIQTGYIRFMRNFGSKQISVFGQSGEAKLWNFLRQSCGMRVISAQTLIAPYWICAAAIWSRVRDPARADQVIST